MCRTGRWCSRIPKRLRAYCLYRRRLLGEIARVAARTVTAAIRTLTGERDLAVGIVACLQTHGSRANWHPHLHLLVTDGGFRPDGTFVTWPAHDAAQLTEAFRRAVLRLFVRLELFDEDQAAGMLTWPHSGFHVHTAVWVAEDDRAFATRLARYCARNPLALERLTYDRATHTVTYRSDKSEGPTAGTETVDPLAFLARALVHIPDKGHGHHALLWLVCQSPPRHAATGRVGGADPPTPIVTTPRLAPTEASRRWAALLQQIFEVDPLALPHLPRRHADRRVHHPALGDRPDPGAPRHPHRRTEPALDPGTHTLGRTATTDGRRLPRPLKGPERTESHPGHPVGDGWRARRSGIEPRSGDGDPRPGGGDEPGADPTRPMPQ